MQKFDFCVMDRMVQTVLSLLSDVIQEAETMIEINEVRLFSISFCILNTERFVQTPGRKLSADCSSYLLLCTSASPSNAIRSRPKQNQVY